MSKVKINPKYPNNPGLLEGKYWLFVDNKLDFMDDTNMFPTKAQLRFKPSELGLTDMEDISTKQRAARDAYLKDSNELFYVHLRNFRMTGDAYPKAFSNRSVDLALPSRVDGNYQETPAHKMTRFVFPSQVDGSNNWPAVHIEGAEMHPWDNPSMPKKAVKLLSKVDNWSIESLINRLDFQSGGDAGSAGFSLPLSLGMSNPFLGATISWLQEEQYYNGNQWATRLIDYVWVSYYNQQFSNVFNESGQYITGVEDGTGIILNYQDMNTFYRAVKDDFMKMGNEIALFRTVFPESHNIDGDDAKLNAAIAATGLTAKQAELSLVQEQLANLNLEFIALVNADQILIDAKQAEITAKQIEIDVKQAELNLAQEQLDNLNYELSQLINDGADQTLIDAKQAELDVKQAELVSKQADLNSFQEQLASLNLELTAIINAEQILIADKQAEIDAKQIEIDAKNEELKFINAELANLNSELEVLINDGADQTLIDAKQAEIVTKQAEIVVSQADLLLLQEQLASLNLELTALITDSADQAEIAAKQAEIDAKNVEVNLVTDELNNLTTEVNQLILLLTKQNGMMKAYSLMKTWFLSNPLPNIDMAKCTVNGVVSPELKNAFANSGMMQNLVGNDLITAQQLQQLQENPVTPLEYFGEINLNFVPAVKYVAELKGVEGQMGDMIFVEEIGSDMAFDGVNWTEKQYNIFDANMLQSARATQDAKFKAFNEVSLAMKPFTWAAHHFPAYMITENNEIRTESDRTVFDFVSFHATGIIGATGGTTPQ